MQGLAEGDVSSPLLLQLLSQHIAQQPLQQGSVPAYRPAPQAAAAAAPDYMHSAGSASVPQQQQQESAAYAAAVAAQQRASKSGSSYVDDVEEDVLTGSMLHSQSHEEEEYAAVFVSTLLLPCLCTCPVGACATSKHRPLLASTLLKQQVSLSVAG
jgi:hypothetical protein